MENIEQNILVTIYITFEQQQKQGRIKGIGDEDIAEHLKINIDQVRVYLKDLENKGYINLPNAASYKKPERVFVGNIMSEGRLAAKKFLQSIQ